jgi:hypothetical protein
VITEEELLQAIRACETAPLTEKKVDQLATYYILYDHLFGDPPDIGYSRNSAPDGKIHVSGTTEFLEKSNGKDSEKLFGILDELVSGTIKHINPRLYDAIIRRIDDI